MCIRDRAYGVGWLTSPRLGVGTFHLFHPINNEGIHSSPPYFESTGRLFAIFWFYLGIDNRYRHRLLWNLTQRIDVYKRQEYYFVGNYHY